MTGLLLAVDESRVSAGPLGLLVVVLMVVATLLLIRNMNGRLKRLPREFDAGPAAGPVDQRGDAPPADLQRTDDPADGQDPRHR